MFTMPRMSSLLGSGPDIQSESGCLLSCRYCTNGHYLTRSVIIVSHRCASWIRLWLTFLLPKPESWHLPTLWKVATMEEASGSDEFDFSRLCGVFSNRVLKFMCRIKSNGHIRHCLWVSGSLLTNRSKCKLSCGFYLATCGFCEEH